jgi:hypothetical protein
LGVLWVLEDQPAEVLWAWELLEVLWALMMAAWSVALFEETPACLWASTMWVYVLWASTIRASVFH